jgi:hypothetical protein
MGETSAHPQVDGPVGLAVSAREVWLLTGPIGHSCSTLGLHADDLDARDGLTAPKWLIAAGNDDTRLLSDGPLI